MTRHSDPAKQIRNQFIDAMTEPGKPFTEAITEGIARWKQFRETAPDAHQAIVEALHAGRITDDGTLDSWLSDAVKITEAAPSTATWSDGDRGWLDQQIDGIADRTAGRPSAPARTASGGTPSPGSYVAGQGSGTAGMPDMAAMSSVELQAATLDAFGGYARATRRT